MDPSRKQQENIYKDIKFDWNVNSLFCESRLLNPVVNNSIEKIDDEYLPVKKMKKLTHSKKYELEKAEEVRIQETEKELIDMKDDPKSADQFDRLLLGQPNNSKLWIKYMSFHLQATEFEKAKIVAHRALQIINSHEETERLNIWVALLNMENLYGTKESLKSCLEEAVRTNDDYTIYSKMLGIFANSDKMEELNELVNKMCKKFKTRLDGWLCCADVYFKLQQPDKARHLLQRGLVNVPEKAYITLISRFSLLENRYGYQNEARTLLEHILTTYPGRVDIWFCYADMLIKSGDVDSARQVLEKACTHKLPEKKMKSLFSKRLSVEMNHGNDETVKHIKAEVQNYVKNACLRSKSE